MKDKMIEVIHEAVSALFGYPGKEVSLFHHNDTDGLSSGAILMNSFERIGYTVSRFSLEKPYPQVLEMIFSKSNQILIFADFAGKIAPLISKMNGGRNLVIILDHHPAEDVDDEMVFNLDGELYGLKGDRDISASSVCYLFADILLNQLNFEADDLSHLGTLGAIGDGFLVDGALSGINRELMEIAVERKLIRVVKNESGEEYFITLGGFEYPAAYITSSLDTLGGVGYYQDGTTLGMEICLHGMNPEIMKQIETYNKTKDTLFEQGIKFLKENIVSTEHLQWFNLADSFRPMGVKMVGVFCNEIKDMDFLDKTKYLAGFQIVPDEVPGFGPVTFNSTKISMRVSNHLTERIRSGESPGLNTFLPEATINIGGFVDACHGLSAATTVKVGEEELLINEVEKGLKKRMENNG
ncbi:MAG: DHH family phosphoesterase [Spirochaetales bacterium]|nr:DHH family phosphoesterase [Spirochaetales bacterium]